jgi:hypothetical protein
MVKKTIILQIVIFGLLAMTLINQDFYETRLYKAQKELDFWQLARKAASDTAWFNQLDISSGKFIIVDWESDNKDAFPLFEEIISHPDRFRAYKIIAISPFTKEARDDERISPFSKIISFKFREHELDKLMRGIPFRTISEYKKIKSEMNAGYMLAPVTVFPIVLVLEKNRIISAEKRRTSLLGMQLQ